MKIPSKLIDFLDIRSKSLQINLIFVAMLAGIINTVLLIILNMAAKDFDKPDIDARLFIMFLLCIAIFLISKRFLSQKLTILVQDAVFSYRERILKSIKEIKLISYEQIGKNQILSVLSEKTEQITSGVHMAADGVPAVIMLICSFAYLGTISLTALWISLFCILAAIITIYMLIASMAETMQEAIKSETEYFGYMQHVLYGFNELKINQKKTTDLFNNYLRKSSLRAMEKKIDTDISNMNIKLYGQVYFYILLACVIYLVPQITDLSSEKIMAITMVILFILGPVTIIIDMMPTLTKANIAVEFLFSIENQLAQAKENIPEINANSGEKQMNFNEIELSDLLFSYPVDNGSRSFSVGPFNLNIKKGELIFIRGGNGSGKSTFLKLITSLYKADSGLIKMDGQIIENSLLHRYRNLFAIVFADFHLFDRIYGLESIDNELIHQYLQLMGLDKKTEIKDGAFSNINLSTGQKKRLALIVAMIEEKSIYVFDEVAADQDPQFKQFFYRDILQKLKSQGKTMIVVTHDEQYFHYCDRLLFMESGSLKEEAIT